MTVHCPLDRQRNGFLFLFSWAPVRATMCTCVKTCTAPKIKPGIVPILLATKAVEYRQMGFFWAILFQGGLSGVYQRKGEQGVLLGAPWNW